MTRHSGLTAERWAAFAREDRIPMIANEMHRGGKLLGEAHRAALRALLFLTPRSARQAGALGLARPS